MEQITEIDGHKLSNPDFCIINSDWNLGSVIGKCEELGINPKKIAEVISKAIKSGIPQERLGGYIVYSFCLHILD